MADARVFSVTDFKEGLDVRKTALTAPGGTLRILENAVLNQGGEIEKRKAFVPVGTMDDGIYLVGHREELHAFTFGTGPSQGNLPNSLFVHQLQSPPGGVGKILDVEPFANGFFVCAGAYCWFDDVLVKEVDGSYSQGTYARAFKGKMYRCDGQFLRFSGVNNPLENDPASVTSPGAGFIDVSLSNPNGETVDSLEIYYGDMALFSRTMVQIWSLDPDPSLDTLKQVLRIGTVAPQSVRQYGTGDVLFLSDSGVRSLKALYINLAASVSDVGSSVDPLLIEGINAEVIQTAQSQGVVQTIGGRYWIYTAEGTIYVLSYFPAGNITAWSVFLLGTDANDFAFDVSEFVTCGNRLYFVGSDGVIYLYGGVTGNQYDSCLVRVRTPHMNAGDPTQNKRIKSIGLMCQGQWSVSVGMLPNDTEAFELAATVQDNTYGLMSIPFAGYGTHFGVHLEHQAPGPALLAALHFNLQEGVVT